MKAKYIMIVVIALMLFGYNKACEYRKEKSQDYIRSYKYVEKLSRLINCFYYIENNKHIGTILAFNQYINCSKGGYYYTLYLNAIGFKSDITCSDISEYVALTIGEIEYCFADEFVFAITPSWYLSNYFPRPKRIALSVGDYSLTRYNPEYIEELISRPRGVIDEFYAVVGEAMNSAYDTDSVEAVAFRDFCASLERDYRPCDNLQCGIVILGRNSNGK